MSKTRQMLVVSAQRAGSIRAFGTQPAEKLGVSSRSDPYLDLSVEAAVMERFLLNSGDAHCFHLLDGPCLRLVFE
jgi:hypothetical protein